ncbi:MAG: hypothetical protein HY815_17410, partial [Candidatus Riflebacteria bacterium]|nr:hypothetical protein [Candidatus Riflebacteria bacterium]
MIGKPSMMVLALAFMPWLALLAEEQPAAQALKPKAWVNTKGGSWKLVSSVFSRQTNKVLRVPSWTGTYELQVPPSPKADGAAPQQRAHTLTTTVYYFPTPDRTKDVMVNPSGGGFKTDLKAQIPGVDDAYGMSLQVTQATPLDATETATPGKYLVEVRCRRGRVVYTFRGRPVGVDLLSFASEFLRENHFLGEWKETAIVMTLKLDEGTALSLEFHLRRVVCRADQNGIQRGESAPLEDAKVKVDAEGSVSVASSDARGVARITVNKMMQRRAILFRVAVPGNDRETIGLLKLRYGREKEKLLDAGRYQSTPAPTGPATAEVSKRVYQFLRTIFHDDLGRFPRALDQDRLGVMEYTPVPQLLQILSWRLSKEAKDKEAALEFKACLPLDKSREEKGSYESQKDPATTAQLDCPEAALGLAVETGDLAWLEENHLKLGDSPPPRSSPKSWNELLARRCLVLWRVAELGRGSAQEAQAKRESDALVRSINGNTDPVESSTAKNRVVEIVGSGSPGAHTWAAVALFKGFEMVGDASYKACALAQVQHLKEKHLADGVLCYSHLAPGERPGATHSAPHREGAYREIAALVHGLLLSFHHTHDRAYSDTAILVRNNILGCWRKEYGGFGKLDYWDNRASGESKDPRAQLKPLASKRMASIYQQAWALIIFMPTLYPYWGEGVKE